MLFSQDIGIDLGTANTLVFVKGKGIIIREPSVVAVDQRYNPVRVVAVGSEAKDMIGRTPGSIGAVRPLRNGVIADFDATAEMLRKFIRKAITASPFSKTRVMICVPSGVTEVERRAVNDAAKSAGARYVSLIEQPMAAAIGAGLPVEAAKGSMIVDIGGGTAEVAVVALGDIVTSRSVKVAGDSYDEAIINYIRKKYSLLIGERTAEDIKIQIGSAFPYEGEGAMNVKGRNLVDGLPKDVEVSADEIREALKDSISQVLDAIRTTLENTPPELSADIIDGGITLTGGGALLRGLDKLIEKEVKIPVTISDNPLDCVVEGTGICLEKHH
ncbi:MAG: rod shape-determining protein [Clostridia bacterium]|nr:rod shape-determining protein [Clostridia bacterium]MBQ3128343.1 rod shape-determining protein [Clostridia bacterium]MBQ7044203.1 rod shape-determining protein [Clostridia bacterium]